MPANRAQSSWAQLPLPLYEQVQLNLTEGERCLSLAVCKAWRAMSLELSQLWEVVALVVQSAEGLRRRCLPWLRWVAAWQRAGRAPPVQLILEYNIPWVLDEAVQQDLMAPLCFALGACHRSLACLSLHLPIQLYNGCAFLASLTNLVQLRLECGDVEATGVFDAISHLTALTCLKVAIDAGNEHDAVEEINLPPKLVELQLNNLLYLPLPDSFSTLAELTKLDLSGSYFVDYEEWARDWEPTWAPQHVQVLSLQGCSLGQVPPWLTNLCSLRKLDLSKNPLSEDWWAEAQPFSALSQLSNLNVSGVQWGELPASLVAMTSLRHLSMAQSPARLLLGPYLHHLTSLVISWDQGKPPLSGLPNAKNLESLQLQGSKEGPMDSSLAAHVLLDLFEVRTLKRLSMELKAVSWGLMTLNMYSRLRTLRPQLQVAEI